MRIFIACFRQNEFWKSASDRNPAAGNGQRLGPMPSLGTWIWQRELEQDPQEGGTLDHCDDGPVEDRDKQLWQRKRKGRPNTQQYLQQLLQHRSVVSVIDFRSLILSVSLRWAHLLIVCSQKTTLMKRDKPNQNLFIAHFIWIVIAIDRRYRSSDGSEDLWYVSFD